MKNGILLAFFGLVISTVTFAQTSGSTVDASGKSATSLTKGTRGVQLASATEISGELQSQLDVEKAKVGDQVVVKTKKAIKQNGEVVVGKGAKLIGRVTEVKERAKGEATSRIGILFETLKDGDVTMPVQASIVSVLNVASRATVGNSDLWADSSTSASGSARTTSNSSSSGGLLGGVTQTAGGVLNTATSTVGGVASTATSTVNGTTSTVGSLGRIEVSGSTETSASGSSTLSLTGGDLKLEKGTTFNVNISSRANAGN